MNETFANDTPLTIELLNKLKYLDRFIKEVLRLYPSVPMIGREVCKDIELPSEKYYYVTLDILNSIIIISGTDILKDN